MTLTLTTNDTADFLNVIFVKLAHQRLLECAEAVVVAKGKLPKIESDPEKAAKLGVEHAGVSVSHDGLLATMVSLPRI